jgi:hypothetical protein
MAAAGTVSFRKNRDLSRLRKDGLGALPGTVSVLVGMIPGAYRLRAPTAQR